MAFITADRVKDTSTTTGTGNITVSGSAPFGYRTFSTVLSVSDTFYYCIQGQGTSEWEVGYGTYVSSNQFARTTVLASSASGSAVSFSSGTKNVFITLPADKTFQLDLTTPPIAGSVIYGTGTGIGAYSAAGLSGQVLTSNASAPPTWTSVSGTGTVTSVNVSAGSTGLTTSGGPITASGTITIAGTLAIANGGTNSTATPTAGAIPYGTGTALAYSAVGTSGQLLTSSGTGAPTWSTVAVQLAISPTQQIFTSGSGTYTLPSNVKWIRVRMVGGGGGGSGSGTGTSGGTGGTGGTTTFGTSLLTVVGGVGGTSYIGSSGGTATINSPATGIAATGSSGAGATYQQANVSGTSGGTSPFSGAGGGGPPASAGVAAISNSGSGGGGGGTSTTASSGCGGGSGGFIDAIIRSPSATYAYAIGAGGTAGAAGTSGSGGGVGGSGYIIVEEHYNY